MTPTWPRAVATLLADGRLEAVPPDPRAALGRLDRAEEKLEVAERVATIDVEVAYPTG